LDARGVKAVGVKRFQSTLNELFTDICSSHEL
jgi:hypothetical protein